MPVAGFILALPLALVAWRPWFKLPPGAADVRVLSIVPDKFDHVKSREIPVIESFGTVDRAANRISFTQKDVHLWIGAHPAGWRESFRVDGLENPEVQIRRGTRLSITLLNLDYRTVARISLGPVGPPFPIYMPDNRMWTHIHLRRRNGIVTESVAPRDLDTIYSAVITAEARTVGRAWYYATPPQSANIGNYGLITVVP